MAADKAPVLIASSIFLAALQSGLPTLNRCRIDDPGTQPMYLSVSSI